MTRSLTELARPQTKASGQREKINMTDKEARIRVEVRKATVRPDNTIKTDIVLYSHGAGRINYWVSQPDNNNYDIVSYYFIHNMAEIKVFDENLCIKIIKL